MAMTIGRAVGLRPLKVEYSGNTVSIDGWAMPATNNLAAVIAIRQQLLGLADNIDEDVIPVTCAEEPSLDGFYRVTSVGANYFQGMGKQTSVGFSITLEKIPGYGQALFEVKAVAINRTSITGAPVTIGAGLVAIPGSATDVGKIFRGSTILGSFWLSAASLQTRPYADPAGTLLGTMLEYQSFAGTNGIGATSSVKANQVLYWRFFMSAANYYSAACTINVTRNSVAYPVVGREYDDTSAWSISNGVIRCSVDPATAQITVGRYTGSAWVSDSFQLVSLGPLSNFNSASRMRILRNGPEECTVRVSVNGTYSGTVDISAVVDITVRRGVPYLSFQANSSGAVYGWAIRSLGALAGSSVTGGLVQTTAVSGVKYVLAIYDAGATNNSVGEVYTTAGPDPFAYMIGMIATSGSGPVDTAQHMIDAWMVSVHEKQRVIAR